jgi:hypothetical protein
MQTNEFLSAVLGGDGYICVFGANPEKKRVIQKLYSTVEAAAATAEDLMREGFDAYFGLATFINGNSRRADNAKSLKSFFSILTAGRTSLNTKVTRAGKPMASTRSSSFAEARGYLSRPW